MKKIGLVTLWQKNYGSVLQCYSTKTEIEKRGFQCDVLYRKLDDNERYLNKLNTLFAIIKNTIFHPSYIKFYFLKKKSSQLSVNSLSQEASEKIDRFVRLNLCTYGCSNKLLSQIGKSKEYASFIVGSDQVWNGTSPYQPFYFLNFAPANKTVAFAPSFGGSEVKSYNRRYFSKRIKQIKYISAREDSGVQIIKELSGRNAERLPDPTVLLSNEEWSAFSNVSLKYEKYILVHFLDNPNEISLKVLKILNELYKLPIVCFSYQHDSLELFNVDNINGSPQEYVSYIRNATYVLTDSFHTLLFSLRFEKQFYVFQRQYKNGQNQTSRIISLLDNCDYANRLIVGEINAIDDLPSDMHSTKDFFDCERTHALNFLNNAIGVDNDAIEKTRLKEKDDCTGCGLCLYACNKNAIVFKESSLGYSVPEINHSVCVNCNRCKVLCNKIVCRNQLEKKEGYIAYNKNDVLRSISASGGVFSALAAAVIKNGGVVCGAKMIFENGRADVKHVCIEKLEELPAILQSKYVQSDCSNVYGEIQSFLHKGKIVLFCGTSCQVDALYKIVPEKYYNSLFTVDLICHGVPGIGLFNNYISFLTNKSHKRVVSYSFREKIENEIKYVETVRYLDQTEEKKQYSDSLYCWLFLTRETYRESCYKCKFATVNKPADITIGDYFEAKRDFPMLFKDGAYLSDINYLSSVLIHTERGKRLIDLYGDELFLHEIDWLKIAESHEQLCHPSRHSAFRQQLIALYKAGGFGRIEQYYEHRKILSKIKKIITSR